MNKLSLVTLIAALAISPTAFAADSTTAVGAAVGAAASTTAGANAASASVDTSASASTDASATSNAMSQTSANGQLSYDQLIGDINAGDPSVTVTAIGSVNDSAKVTIVPVSSIQGGATADAKTLADAQTSGSDRLGKIRTALHANASLEAALTAKGYTDADVLAVQADANANVWIYVQDKK